jgi:hypothetical protein
MKHFLFEDKAYRISAGYRSPKRERDSAQALSRLLRNRNVTPSSGGSARGIRAGTRLNARQNCVVKLNYSKSLAAHKVQLEKYLVGLVHK